MYHPVTAPLRGPFSVALLFESAPFLPRLAVKSSFHTPPARYYRCVRPTLIIGLLYRLHAYEYKSVKSAALLLWFVGG